jgi:tRNA-splicing ligase RtcB
MHLMGDYAQANHEVIHRHLLNRLGAKGLVTVQNHHNFAWSEEHGGRQVIVHRKGAIPAHEGQLGIIPGNMAAAGYVVRGRGFAEALSSAAHGAGRKLSRSVAKKELGWGEARKLLEKKGVTLLSAGLDETPLAYKDIREVMAAQTDLVDIVARFQPKIVKMGA